MLLWSEQPYATSRINSNLKGSTKQFGWLQASATKLSSLSIISQTLQPCEFVSQWIFENVACNEGFYISRGARRD